MHDALLLEAIERFGSPLYVYDFDALCSTARALLAAFARHDVQVLYAVKANSNARVLQALHCEGLAFDACSVGEVQLLLRLGISPSRVHFNADAVTLDEMRSLTRTVGGRDVELTVGSLDHLRALVHPDVAWARPIALRLNTGFGAGHSAAVTTGGELSKFGLSLEDLDEALAWCLHHQVRCTGFHSHAGSGIGSVRDYLENARRLVAVALACGLSLDTLNVGGGFPHDYGNGQGLDFDLDSLAAAVESLAAPLRQRSARLRLLVEPGRCLVAGAGVLLCTVASVKRCGDRQYVSVDSGFHHLARPFLYGAYHGIDNLSASPDAPQTRVDIVGQLCQSGDVFARDRGLAQPRVGDRLCIRDAGAYGYAMSSNYNARPRPAEVALMNDQLQLIRRRETLDDLLRLQTLEKHTC